jgi:uncharacterized iron-regulated membrane protein
VTRLQAAPNPESASNMIRVHHRVGRRTWVSAPLWLALLGYLVWASVAIAVALAVAVVIAGMALIFLLWLLGQVVVARVRRRRARSR